MLTIPASFIFPMMGLTIVASMCTPSKGWNSTGQRMSQRPRIGSSKASPCP